MGTSFEPVPVRAAEGPPPDVLAAAMAAMAAAADLAALASVIVARAELLGLAGPHLLVADPSGGCTLAAWRGLPEAVAAGLRSIPPESDRPQLRLLRHDSTAIRLLHPLVAETLPDETALVTAPLVHGGRLHGLLGWQARGAEALVPTPAVRCFAEVAAASLGRVLRQERERAGTNVEMERYRDAIRHARVVVFRCDRDLRYTWASNTSPIAPEEAIGKSDHDLFPTPDADRLVALKRQVLETGEPLEALVWTSVLGDDRLFQLSLRPLRDRKGDIVGILGSAANVTRSAAAAGERERLLYQREMERSWLLAVIERTPTGILLVEKHGAGEQVTANRRAAELLGHEVDPEKARIVVAGRLLEPDGKPIPFELLPSSRALRGERISLQESLLRRPDGSEIPIVVSAGPILDRTGAQAGAVVCFEDVSAFKELERLREQWTSLITHDLRQPITSIAGFAGVLAEHPDMPPHLRPKLQHIISGARRLARMTSDLLDASRLEARQLTLERQATDLAALVRAVTERLGPDLLDRAVIFEAGGELPLVSADPERIEQVLGNLLSNAAKYGTEGAPIRVELATLADDILVTVTNRGEGLGEEELASLFRRFHRTDKARRSRVRGLGLGLYIARGLVEAHGGRIWAACADGAVSFRFTLPLPD